MYKKILFVLSMLLVAALLLSSCASPENLPQTGETEAPPGTAATEGAEQPSGEPVSISIWHGYIETEEQLFSQSVNDFMAANPNITVELLAVPFTELVNKFQTEAAAGGGPTIIMGPQDRMAGYATAGLLAPIPEDTAFLSDLLPASVEGGRVAGELVGVPVNNKVLALFYNKSMVTEEPADFDALLAAAQENGMALTADWFHNYMWAPAFGATFLDENGKVVLDSPEGAEAYSYFKTVCETEGVTCDANDGDMDTLFRQGEVAFRIQGPWASGDFINDLGAENIGVVAIPPIPGQAAPRPWNQAEMASVSINATPEQIDAALQFLEYFTSTDVQAKFLNEANWIPANSSVDTSTNPVVGGFLEQVPNSDPFPVIPELGATWDPMGNAITQIIEGVQSPEEALGESAQLINTTNNKQ
jgi:arabinogalactan oligomer/maltooligosaccharide transport system substrate-binding protein